MLTSILHYTRQGAEVSPRLAHALRWGARLLVATALLTALALRPFETALCALLIVLAAALHARLQVWLWQREMRRWSRDTQWLEVYAYLPAPAQAQIRAVLDEVIAQTAQTAGVRR